MPVMAGAGWEGPWEEDWTNQVPKRPLRAERRERRVKHGSEGEMEWRGGVRDPPGAGSAREEGKAAWAKREKRVGLPSAGRLGARGGLGPWARVARERQSREE